MNDAPKTSAYGPGKPPRTIALIGKYQSTDIAEALHALAGDLSLRGVTVLIETETAKLIPASSNGQSWQACDYAAIGERADIAIVLGGDGTMLNAARRLACAGVPLVGVNQGRLGFMTDIARSDMLTSMDDLLGGLFLPEDRMLLDAEIFRDGRQVGANLALNDVVVDKGAIGRLIEFKLFIDGEFIYDLRSDGIIVNTPTGSTAYSLSANGPILHPKVRGIALVPLCPHSLTNRPILVGDRDEVEIRISDAVDPRVHFDGQVTLDLKVGDAVRVRRSKYAVCLLHPPGYSYFTMLRQKLHWSEHPTVR